MNKKKDDYATTVRKKTEGAPPRLRRAIELYLDRCDGMPPEAECEKYQSTRQGRDQLVSMARRHLEALGIELKRYHRMSGSK